jgi:hypothetical protein
MSAVAASKKFGIPRSTLGDRLTGKVLDDATLGRKPILPPSIEKEIVDVVCLSAERGFGITKAQLLNRVGSLTKAMKLPTPFKDGLPGNDFWEGFKKRHPDISLRTPEALALNRSKAMNPVIVGGYFRQLKTLLAENNLTDKPHLIWNADETSVPFTHAPAKVVARTGTKRVPGRVSNSREPITMLPCINAAGTSMPPIFIVKGKTMASVTSFDTSAAPEGSKFTFQKNAWMENILSTEWFEGIFLKHCGPERPQLLIWDSHSSHETLSVLEKARENNILVFTFPPHTTHCLCPLDIAIFRPFKVAYNKMCSNYMSSDPGNTITKATVCPLITQAYQQAFRRGNVAGSFQAAGIVPWDPLVIKRKDFSPSEPHDRCENLLSSGDHPLSWVIARDDGRIQPTGEAPSTSRVDVQPEPEAQEATGEATLPLEVIDGDGMYLTTVDVPVLTVAAPEEYLCDVHTIFGTPTVCKTDAVKPSKRVTVQRLLTSDEIIVMKEHIEKEKEERKRKREEKKVNKSQKKPATTKGNSAHKDKGKAGFKRQSRYMELCMVCHRSEQNSEGLWTMCEVCLGWMHNACVPSFHKSSMDIAIDGDLPYVCFLCSL